jgi:hypothetical protein
MRLHRGVLLTVIAVVAISVISVASASATTPEFKPVPAKKKFSETGGTVTFRQAGNEYTCAKSTSTGEVTGARTVGKVAMVLKECITHGSGGTGCALNSAGAKNNGEIVMKSLDGELGTIKTTEAPSGVGLLLKPEVEKKWTTLEANSCTGATLVTGMIAAEVPTIGKKQTTNKLVVKQGYTGGIRTITLDSGKLEEPGFVMWSEETSVQTTDELTFEEALEVT